MLVPFETLPASCKFSVDQELNQELKNKLNHFHFSSLKHYLQINTKCGEIQHVIHILVNLVFFFLIVQKKVLMANALSKIAKNLPIHSHLTIMGLLHPLTHYSGRRTIKRSTMNVQLTKNTGRC